MMGVMKLGMLGGGFRVGRLFGIPVILDLSFFLIFFLAVWMLSGLFTAGDDLQRWGFAFLGGIVLFGSLLLHELAHSLMARKFGLEVSSITLVFFGGYSMIKDEPEKPGHEFAISVVGPLANLVIGAILVPIGLLVLDRESPLGQILYLLGAMNLVVGCFNLLPGFPLDGGHIFRSIIWKITGSPYRATRAAAAFGQLFAAFLFAVGALGLLGVIQHDFVRGTAGLWPLVVGFLLWTQARHAARSAELQHDLHERRVDELMLQPTIGRTVDADFLVVQAAPRRARLDHREAFFVRDQNRDTVIGILPASAILLLDDARYNASRVRDVMIPAASLTPIDPAARADEALKRLQGDDAPRLLPVVSDGRLLGLVGIDQIIAALREPQPALRGP